MSSLSLSYASSGVSSIVMALVDHHIYKVEMRPSLFYESAIQVMSDAFKDFVSIQAEYIQCPNKLTGLNAVGRLRLFHKFSGC